MLTKKDLIAVAKAVVDGMNKEIHDRNLNDRERLAVRGAALHTLNNLWYDVVTQKVRDQFEPKDVVGGSRQAFMDEVWK